MINRIDLNKILWFQICSTSFVCIKLSLNFKISMIASDMAWIAAISGQVLLMPQRCFDAASELIHLTRISSCEIENINNFINNDHNEKVKNDFESPRSTLSLYALHSSLHGLHRWGTEGVALTRSMDVVVVFSPRINPGNRRPKPFLTRRFGCQYG